MNEFLKEKLGKKLGKKKKERLKERKEEKKRVGEGREGERGRGNCFLCGDLFVKPRAKGEGRPVKGE